MNLKSILIVDDNQSDIELTKRALNKLNLGVDIFEVDNGQDALDFLLGEGKFFERDTSMAPNLIFLDLKMPIINGLEVLRRIRANKHTHRQVVVMLTSSNEEQDMIDSYNLGVNSFILKSIDFRKFTETLRQACVYWLKINVAPPLSFSGKQVANRKNSAI